MWLMNRYNILWWYLLVARPRLTATVPRITLCPLIELGVMMKLNNRARTTARIILGILIVVPRVDLTGAAGLP
jgi:hypothetical protein